jgi:hypothetical protein
VRCCGAGGFFPWLLLLCYTAALGFMLTMLLFIVIVLLKLAIPSYKKQTIVSCFAELVEEINFSI